MEHIESRSSLVANSVYDIYLEIRCGKQMLNKIVGSIKNSIQVVEVTILESINKKAELGIFSCCLI